MSAPLPLEGIRVLTLEQVHALPWGTAFLADLGAQVIRIESLDHLQDRKSGPFPNGKPGPEWWNEGGNLAYFGVRNKQSLCLEVTRPEGKEVFLKLVKNCDIVTDNFRPGTMRRFGFDHETLSQINPRIITLSSTAYGYTGPWRSAGSRARTVDAACGMSSLTGYEGGPSVRASNNYMDHSTGNNVAFALMLALYRRKRTGKGMRIDLTMQETGVSCIGPAILEAQRGITRPRLGCSHLWKAPHNVYACAGRDRWIAIAVASDGEWTALKQAMGNPSWSQEPRYDTAQERWQNRHELDRKIGGMDRTAGRQGTRAHAAGAGGLRRRRPDRRGPRRGPAPQAEGIHTGDRARRGPAGLCRTAVPHTRRVDGDPARPDSGRTQRVGVARGGGALAGRDPGTCGGRRDLEPAAA